MAPRGVSCRGVGLALALAAALAVVAVRADAPAPIFEPEADWKEIQPGEHLPGGLDIRMDLASGKKWARLLPTKTPAAAPAPAGSSSGGLQVAGERGVAAAPHGDALAVVAPAPAAGSAVAVVATEDGSGNASPPSPPVESPAVVEDDGLTDAERGMRSVLLGLPQPEPELADAIAAGMPPAELRALLARLWAARQVELRAAMSSAKTEAQQMNGLLARLLTAEDDDAREGALLDLEYLVSQLHNAEDFTGMGGLPPVVALLNASSPAVASAAAWVLGSATKYAPGVQSAALAAGGVIAAADMLEAAVAQLTVAGARGSDAAALASKAVYALGGQLRGHAAGMAQWAALDGTARLAAAVRAALALHSGGGGAPQGTAAPALMSKLLALAADLYASPGGGAGEVDGDAPAATVSDGRFTALGSDKVPHAVPMIPAAADAPHPPAHLPSSSGGTALCAAAADAAVAVASSLPIESSSSSDAATHVLAALRAAITGSCQALAAVC